MSEEFPRYPNTLAEGLTSLLPPTPCSLDTTTCVCFMMSPCPNILSSLLVDTLCPSLESRTYPWKDALVGRRALNLCGLCLGVGKDPSWNFRRSGRRVMTHPMTMDRPASIADQVTVGTMLSVGVNNNMDISRRFSHTNWVSAVCYADQTSQAYNIGNCSTALVSAQCGILVGNGRVCHLQESQTQNTYQNNLLLQPHL